MLKLEDETVLVVLRNSDFSHLYSNYICCSIIKLKPLLFPTSSSGMTPLKSNHFCLWQKRENFRDVAPNLTLSSCFGTIFHRHPQRAAYSLERITLTIVPNSNTDFLRVQACDLRTGNPLTTTVTAVIAAKEHVFSTDSKLTSSETQLCMVELGKQAAL